MFELLECAKRVASCFDNGGVDAFALAAGFPFLLNTCMAKNDSNEEADVRFEIFLSPELLAAAENVKSARAAVDINQAHSLNVDSVKFQFKKFRVAINEQDRELLELMARENPEFLDEIVEYPVRQLGAMKNYWEKIAEVLKPFIKENSSIRAVFQRCYRRYKQLNDESEQLNIRIKDNQLLGLWTHVAEDVIELYKLSDDLVGRTNLRLDFYQSYTKSLNIDAFVENGVLQLCRKISDVKDGAGSILLVSKMEKCLVRVWYREFINCPILIFPPFENEENAAESMVLHCCLGDLCESQITFLKLLFQEHSDIKHKSELVVSLAKNVDVQSNVEGQRSILNEIKTVSAQLSASLSAKVDELKALDFLSRTTSAQAIAAANEFKEATAPLREMYKDERLCKAKADALKADIPELVVDAIVSIYHTTKFPSKGTLMKNLGSSGGLKKLEAAGRGNSPATIARWLGKMRNIMTSYGHVEKYRSRIDVSANRPSDRLKDPVEEVENVADDGEIGSTGRDTRGQELPEGSEELD